MGHADKSRAAPKESSSQKWSIRHLKKKIRVARDGHQELTGYVSADWAHSGSVCLRGSEAFHARSVDVVHLDTEHPELCAEKCMSVILGWD